MKTNTPRMMTCETCGHDVADSAKTCPQCGAKFGQGVLAIKMGALLLVLWTSYQLRGMPADYWQYRLGIMFLVASSAIAIMHLANRRRFAGMRDATSAAADPPATVPALRPPPARRRGRDRG